MVSENYGAGPETWARALRMCSSDLGNAEASFEDACERIAALEAENAALREFVAADDELRQYEEDHSLESRLHDQETCEDWYVLQDRHWDIRQRLSAEHGLPLPGAGEGA